jgi:hypothetical protein
MIPMLPIVSHFRTTTKEPLTRGIAYRARAASCRRTKGKIPPCR